ncbi:MAG: ATP-dependent RecD-like DNA helicase [Caldilineaceae bacterium]
MDILRGVVERITFHNEENGYTVAKLMPEKAPSYMTGYDREIAIVGNMPGINVGESLELHGKWTIHGDYGKQFVVERMRAVLPATIAGMEKYLGSGLIKGIGPVMAKRIVNTFGASTLDVIEQSPDRLLETPGIGRKRVQMIIAAWAEQRAIKEVMIFLQSNGVSTSLATKIYKNYGDQSIAIVKDDPYRLARDIYGIGFLTADKIAQSLGLPPDAPQRIAAGVAYTLSQASDEGHVYLPMWELIKQTGELISVPPTQIGSAIITLQTTEQVKIDKETGRQEEGENVQSPISNLQSPVPQLVAESGQLYSAATVAEVDALLKEDPPIYLTPLFYSEQGVANRLRRLVMQGEERFELFTQYNFEWESTLAQLEQAVGIQLATQQRQAIQAAMTNRLTVLTGGPGTGKTTCVRSILQLCERVNRRAVLAAPTGRAAKRLAETTGREAKTIHRLLEFKPAEGMQFQRNEENPLEGDLLIVDEASMLDLVLTNHLLKAVPPGMHLLLVGDVDQLPSVGAGNVLKDVINAIEDTGQSDKAIRNPQSAIRNSSVVRLQTIFRQDAGSYIITNAHRINQGQMPVIDNDHATDFFLFKTEEPERAAQLCVELVQTRIPRRFAIPTGDIQVLCPMHRGVVGVGALNEAIQAALNPFSENKPEKRIGSRAYRVGDRVMQIRNNYDKEVYNGDIGIITQVDVELQKVKVNLDGRAIEYDFLELDELTHAFAMSIHKAQGSEYPAVVIPVLTTHYMMLQRNLLYTAVTRAKRLVVLVGQPKAISMAVRNDKVAERFSGLQERIVGL